jgi:hypothetical protein
MQIGKMADTLAIISFAAIFIGAMFIGKANSPLMLVAGVFAGSG